MQFAFVAPLGLVVVLQHDNKQHLCESYSKLDDFNILMLPLKNMAFNIPSLSKKTNWQLLNN